MLTMCFFFSALSLPLSPCETALNDHLQEYSTTQHNCFCTSCTHRWNTSPFVRITISLVEPHRKEVCPFLCFFSFFFLLIFVCLSCRHSVPPFRFHFVSFFEARKKKIACFPWSCSNLEKITMKKFTYAAAFFLMNQIMFRLFSACFYFFLRHPGKHGNNHLN